MLKLDLPLKALVFSCCVFDHSDVFLCQSYRIFKIFANAESLIDTMDSDKWRILRKATGTLFTCRLPREKLLRALWLN